MAANSTAVVAPYVAITTGQWDGNDGSWSSFRISVGATNHSQDFRVLISTRGAAAWVPYPEGCKNNDYACASSRGVEPFQSDLSSGFQENKSSTWKGVGLFSLDLEKNLGLNDAGGLYGFDTVRLGFSQDTDASEVSNTQVVGVPDQTYFMGLLGMSNAWTSVSNTDPSFESLIQNLKDSDIIPSLSYGYTAGAPYRHKGVLGSLVIGGYDQSRFKSPPYNFSFAPDRDQFLKVGVQSISTTFSLTTPGAYELTSAGHFSIIDSTVSQLWLPKDVCDSFAGALGLTYDADQNYYLINDTMRKNLLDKNPTFNFKLGNSKDTSAKDYLNIELPYAAFDLSIGSPVYNRTTRYFPIRRAANEYQYTIGRTFLQEAYLVVDYEHKNFSLAQANFSDPLPPRDIQTLLPKDHVPPSPPSGLSSSAVAGIAIGAAVAGLLLLLGALYLCWYRPRRRVEQRRREASVVSAAPPYTENAVPPNYAEGKPYDPFYAAGGTEQTASEMPASAEHQAGRPELEGGGGSYELSALTGEGPVHEMDAGSAEAAGGEGEGERRASAAVGPTEC